MQQSAFVQNSEPVQRSLRKPARWMETASIDGIRFLPDLEHLCAGADGNIVMDKPESRRF